MIYSTPAREEARSVDTRRSADQTWPRHETRLAPSPHYYTYYYTYSRRKNRTVFTAWLTFTSLPQCKFVTTLLSVKRVTLHNIIYNK